MKGSMEQKNKKPVDAEVFQATVILKLESLENKYCEMREDITSKQSDLRKHMDEMFKKYVEHQEFLPVKMFVYGMASVVFTGFLIGLCALVYRQFTSP